MAGSGRGQHERFHPADRTWLVSLTTPLFAEILRLKLRREYSGQLAQAPSASGQLVPAERPADRGRAARRGRRATGRFAARMDAEHLAVGQLIAPAGSPRSLADHPGACRADPTWSQPAPLAGGGRPGTARPARTSSGAWLGAAERILGPAWADDEEIPARLTAALIRLAFSRARRVTWAPR